MKKGCVIAIVLPPISAVIVGVLSLITGLGHPFLPLLEQALSDAGNTFAEVFFIELGLGVLYVLALPGIKLGEHMFDIFFG